MSKPLKNPENYSTAKEMAAWLREVADDCERNGQQMIQCNLQFFYCDVMRWRRSMTAKFGEGWEKK